MTHDENVMSKLTVGEAVEICLKFRHDRNVSECICQYLSDVAELEASKHFPKFRLWLFQMVTNLQTLAKYGSGEMTHDELLAELTDTDTVYARVTLYSALRSVVELHKRDVRGNCDICTYIANGGLVAYPCFTIQAIEKELG